MFDDFDIEFNAQKYLIETPLLRRTDQPLQRYGH
jgi:hypothetical protein